MTCFDIFTSKNPPHKLQNHELLPSKFNHKKICKIKNTNIDSNINNNYKTLKVEQCCKIKNSNINVNEFVHTTTSNTIVNIDGHRFMTFCNTNNITYWIPKC